MRPRPRRVGAGPRVLITARLNARGGIETHLLNLSRALVARGVEVTIASRVSRPDVSLVQLADDLPVRLITTPFSRSVRALRLSTFWALGVWPMQLRRGFQVLLTIEASPFTRFLRRFLAPGGYAIWNRIGAAPRQGEPAPPDLTTAIDGFVAESVMQVTATRRAWPLTMPTAALPLLGHFAAQSRREGGRTGPIRVAFLGRIVRAKGIFLLLQIWRALELESATLTFYGSGPDEAELRRSIGESGLGPTVSIGRPWLDGPELSAILADVDLVVLPSETEGLPVVLLEAMAHGVPFVASDVGAIRTLAEDNPDVRVVPLEQEAIARAIAEMIAAIRRCAISGSRLQQYHRDRIGGESLRTRWCDLILTPPAAWPRADRS